MFEVVQYLSVIGPLQLIGLPDFVLYISAFGWVQLGRLDGNSAKYSLCHVLAASLVGVSLVAEFSLSSALIQGSWILTGLFGLSKRQQRKRAILSQSETPFYSCLG